MSPQNFYKTIFFLTIFSLHYLLFAQSNRADSLLNILKSLAEEDTARIKTLSILAKDAMFGGDYKKAMDYTAEALQLSKKNGFKNGEAASYNSIGAISQLQGNYSEAVKNHFKALKIREETGDKEGAAGSYQNIANIYFFQGKYSDALKYDLTALKIREEVGDPLYIAASFNNIGEDYQSLGNFPEALKSHSASLKIKKEIGDKQGIATSYSNIGNIYLKLADTENSAKKKQLYSDALKNHLASLEIRKEIMDKHGMAESYINLGAITVKLNDFDESEKYWNTALESSKEIGYKEAIKESYRGLSQLDSARGRWKEAYDHHKQYSVVKNSILNEESSRQIAEMQTKYETEKKENENKLLLKDNEVKDLEIGSQKAQKYVSFAAVFVIIFISFLIYNRHKLKREKIFSEELLRQEKLRAKSMMLAQEEERKRITVELHDGIGQMLSTVKLNISSLEESRDIDYQARHRRTMALIDDSCSELRNISHNMMPGLLIKAGLIPAVNDLADKMNSTSLKIFVESNESEERLKNNMEIHLFRIIQELLNNIIKYAEATEVHIQFNQSETDITVMVEDNGKGFDKNILKAGTGDGWNNINPRLEILNAGIEIDSQEGRGTVIFLQAPLNS